MMRLGLFFSIWCIILCRLLSRRQRRCIGFLCSAPGSDCRACASYHGMILFPRTIKTLIPYRAMGPVTVDEYESRQERYDEQLVKKYGVDITGKLSEEKVALLRRFRKNNMKNFRMRFISAGDGHKMGSPHLKP